MKKCFLVISVAILMVFSMSLLCGCDKSIDSDTVTLKEIAVELPDGEWKIDSDYNDESKLVVYDSTEGTVRLGKDSSNTYDMRYFGGSESRMEYFDNLRDAGRLSSVNGYLMQFSISEEGTYAAIKIDNENYYYICFEPGDECETPKETGAALLKGISFDVSASVDYKATDDEYVIDWGEAATIAQDMTADDVEETSEPYLVRGEVKNVTSADGVTFIDIGNAYPSENSVTGVIWSEYASNFESLLKYYIGDTVYLVGYIYPYEGRAQIKLTSDADILVVEELDSLDFE